MAKRRRYGSGGGWFVKLIVFIVTLGIIAGGVLTWVYWEDVRAFFTDTAARVEDKLTDEETPGDSSGGSENETPGENETPVCEHLNVKELPAVDSTCSSTGLTAGTVCSDCGETLVAQEEILALGHMEQVMLGSPATCTTEGLTDFTVCLRCNEVLVPSQTIPAIGHTEISFPPQWATCTETGLSEYRECSTCGEITMPREVLPKVNHYYTDGYCGHCGEEFAIKELTFKSQMGLDQIENYVMYPGSYCQASVPNCPQASDSVHAGLDFSFSPVLSESCNSLAVRVKLGLGHNFADYLDRVMGLDYDKYAYGITLAEYSSIEEISDDNLFTTLLNPYFVGLYFLDDTAFEEDPLYTPKGDMANIYYVSSFHPELIVAYKEIVSSFLEEYPGESIFSINIYNGETLDSTPYVSSISFNY